MSTHTPGPSRRPAEVPGPPCERVDNLGRAEQLVLLSLRRRLEAPEGEGLLRTLFLLACGLSQAEGAMRGLEGLFSTLARHARRELGLHRPACPAVSADERAILGLVEALQAGRQAHAEALARWLVPVSARVQLRRYAALLGEALARSDLYLAPAKPVPADCVAARIAHMNDNA